MSIKNILTPLIKTNKNLCEAVNTDFGAVFSSTPIGVANPKNCDELMQVIKYCYDNNISVISRGMSHSASGQCLSKNGVVIDTKMLNKIHDFNFDGKVGKITVDAGVTWEKLVKYTLQHGAAPEVLTDWQKLTVGGTISTGGLGFMSHQSGIQADLIIEMDVVTGSGELLTCSNEQNVELFNLVRGGLGQYGVIAKLTIKLIKAPKKMHVSKMLISDTRVFHQTISEHVKSGVYSCIHSFLIPHKQSEFIKKFGFSAYELYKNEFELLENSGSFSYFVELVQYQYDSEFTLAKPIDNKFYYYEQDDFFEYVTKEPPLISTQKEKGRTSHPELAVFIAASKFEEFMKDFLMQHNDEDMGDGPVLIMPITANNIKESAFVGLQTDFYFIGILRNAYPNTEENIKTLTKLNEKIYQKALALNGKRYPCDSLAFPASKAEWQIHYGDKWEDIVQGKAKYDPKYTLKSLLTIHHHASA